MFDLRTNTRTEKIHLETIVFRTRFVIDSALRLVTLWHKRSCNLDGNVGKKLIIIIGVERK